MSIPTPIIEEFIPTPEKISRFKEIYLEAFPPEERRPWGALEILLASGGGIFHPFAIMNGDEMIGLITVWQLEEMNYIEHFAISPIMRGNGVGTAALLALMEKMPGNYLLEAEPRECGEIARRRINFYSRLGFMPREDFSYMQPPYAEGLPEVPLTLMTTGNIDPERARDLLWKVVYRKKAVN